MIVGVANYFKNFHRYVIYESKVVILVIFRIVVAVNGVWIISKRKSPVFKKVFLSYELGSTQNLSGRNSLSIMTFCLVIVMVFR